MEKQTETIEITNSANSSSKTSPSTGPTVVSKPTIVIENALIRLKEMYPRHLDKFLEPLNMSNAFSKLVKCGSFMRLLIFA